jgi:GTP-binding protein EngB required for normal cell division
MARLVDGLSRFFGRVEIYARGAESDRLAAEAALTRGRTLEAREHARALLDKVPGSPIGLALWADAAEDAWLDHEVVEALGALAEQVPWRAEVWLRLGRAGARIGWEGAREALERAASAPEDRDSARLALLDLADLDLAAGDWARAERWLDRIAQPLAKESDREALLRRAECALGRGDAARARHEAASLGEPSAVDGRRALLDAALAALAGETAAGMESALRAFSLETPGSAKVLAGLVAGCRDAVLVDRARRVVGLTGKLDEPTWAAAFAFAEGRVEDAREALARGLDAGDSAAEAALLGLAIEARDVAALDALTAQHPELVPPEFVVLREAIVAQEEARYPAALDAFDRVSGDAAAWADARRRELIERWTSGPTAAWVELLGELRRTARVLDRLDLTSALEALAQMRERPLRLAVVGEFNAGKSTFLNALLGEDVAPTGVLPTTAALHWVAWAPDAFARVLVEGAPDRVVLHRDLKATLRELGGESARVRRVFIYAPIERLKRVEVLDTPGFNAPDPEHVEAARQAFDEAHVAVWLLDATTPLKETERRILTEVRELGVPVQILVNKADRLAPAAVEDVLRHVRESLASVGLSSYAEPLALSARLALKGLLGDREALTESGWAEVDALLSQRIVDESESLRERALRRRALRIATELARDAAERAHAETERARAAEDEAAGRRAAAARLTQEHAALARTIDHAIEPARRELARDLRPLGEVEAERRRADAGLRAYVSERFTARLTPPVAAILAGATGLPKSERGLSAIDAVLAGAVASHDAPADVVRCASEPVFAATVKAYAKALLAEADAPMPAAPSVALGRRIEAVRAALAAELAAGEVTRAQATQGR